MASINETQYQIKKALLQSKLGFIDISYSSRRIYKIPETLIDFEIVLSVDELNEFSYIYMYWCYFGPNWKYISSEELLDYKLPDEFRQFIVYNFNLFSKKHISVDDFIEALRVFDDK